VKKHSGTPISNPWGIPSGQLVEEGEGGWGEEDKNNVGEGKKREDSTKTDHSKGKKSVHWGDKQEKIVLKSVKIREPV